MILLRVFLFFLALLFLPDWYIYKAFGRRANRRWMKVACWLPSVLLLVALAFFAMWGQTYQTGLGIYIVVTLCISVPKLIFAVVHAILRFGCRLRALAVWTAAACAALVFAYIVFGATKGKHFYQVKEVTYASSRLPAAFDGYRILQISDLHTGSWNHDTLAMRRAVELCNAQHADMIVFTGDLVNAIHEEATPFLPILAGLQANGGVFSILGNHDYATYYHWNSKADQISHIETLIAREKEIGWDVLMNEHRIIRHGGDSIALIGVENTGKPPFPNRGNLPKALQGTDGMFKVLLSHDPTHWRWKVLPETDIDLMLAGHTHDMQFSIFGFSPSAFIYPEHNGMYLEKGRGLYVNIGLGYVLFPMRIGAWPEITVITLKKK